MDATYIYRVRSGSVPYTWTTITVKARNRERADNRMMTLWGGVPDFYKLEEVTG